MLLDDIALHLQANEIGTVGTSIFKAQLPDSPDFAVGIYEYAGRASDKAFGTTIIFENARFQILVRSDREGSPSAYASARLKAEAIKNLLDGAGNLTLSGVVYAYIEALSSFSIDKDANGRHLISCNFETQKHVG